MVYFRHLDSVLGKRGRNDESQTPPRGGGLFYTGETPTPDPSHRASTRQPEMPSAYPRSDDISDFEFDFGDVQEERGRLQEQGAQEEAEQDDGPHSQEKEQYPDHAAYDPNVGVLVQRASEVASELEDNLARHRKSSADVDTMAQKAHEAQENPRPKKKTIMLLGHTGTGKSSTTNSFVDNLTASKAASSGESSCRTRYAAEIRFFDEENRRSILREQVENYNRYHFELDPSWPDDQKNEYSSLADTALKIFRSLFCDQFDFESPRSIQDYLREYHEQGSDEALEAMEEWCSVLLESYYKEGEEESPSLRFDTATTDELNDLVEPHVFEKNDFEEPALWSLVKHIEKGLRNSRILRHVNLLDLPGTADTNRVRASIAHNFIQQCDALWTVTSIDRPISDAPLDQIFATYAERFQNNIAIIATRSDSNINDNLAKDMRGKNQSIGEYKAHGERIKQLKKELERIKAELKPKGAKKQNIISIEALNERREEKDCIQDELQDIENQQFIGLVDVRNSYVSRRLKEDKQKHLAQGAQLSVFCISNTHYAVHKGEPSEDSRLMDVEMTNIPALRRHALAMAAADEFRNAEQFISKVVTVLQGAALWTDTANTDRHASLMEIVKQLSKLLETFFDDFSDSSHSLYNVEVIAPLVSSRSRFVSAAVKVYEDISGWHPSTARAFFGKNGKHVTKSKSYEVWNERFIDDQTKCLNPCWENMLVKQKSTLRGCIEKITRTVEDIPEQLENDASALPVAMEPLRRMLDAFVTRINNAYEARMDELDKKLSNIKQDASKDVESAYFTQALLPMYKECKTYKGNGCTNNMLNSLYDWLQGKAPAHKPKSPFTKVASGLETDLDDTARWITYYLQGDIRTILQELVAQFDAILKRNMQTSGEAAARAHMRPFLQRAKPEMDAVMEELKSIKRQYGMK